MSLYKNKYRIESNRWQFWDYSAPGSYFITVCVQDKKNILGRIENRKMILSDAGKIVSDFFTEIPTYHKRIVLDEWIVMPNHFHCIMQTSKQINIINNTPGNLN
jgi:REP element-mobilizing transposase RayT